MALRHPIQMQLELHTHTSLIPRLHPAFHRLQYGKAGRAWYLFSRERDVIGKWDQNEQAAFHVLFNRLHTQRSVYTTIALH